MVAMRVELRVLFAVCGLACVSSATGLTDYEICLDGSRDDLTTLDACDRLWPTDDEAVVVSAARTAGINKADARLAVWAKRSLPTVEGSRTRRCRTGDRCCSSAIRHHRAR
jgi:hypothetical protein